jgi:N-acetylmuramoyl-L-alanine amidase
VAVAARENGTTLKQVGDLELILLDLMANSNINESSRLAEEIQRALVANLYRHYSAVRDLGVRQGPFYVLLGATMPSVLVETGFISNPREEARLKDPVYRGRAVDAIVLGVRNYASALNMVVSQ